MILSIGILSAFEKIMKPHNHGVTENILNKIKTTILLEQFL